MTYSPTSRNKKRVEFTHLHTSINSVPLASITVAHIVLDI